MERRSIGQFIAALRKTHGMTQKELAEMLSVSDKAVSRWERDETAPDISLIPVIAEIFGVTSDEILRGEKIINENSVSNEGNAKSEKRLKNLINTAKTKFSVKSIISLGIAIIGLIVSMICNFGFNRARIGFLIGCILFLAAILLEIIFSIYAFSVSNSDDFFGENINGFKKFLIMKCRNTFCAIFCIFAFSLPLVYLAYDAYCGIYFDSWLIQGLICFFAGAAICIFSWWIIKYILSKKGILVLSEAEKIRFKIQKRTVLAASIVLAATVFCQLVFNSCVSYTVFSKGTAFSDINEFIEFMETPKDEYSDSEQMSMNSSAAETHVDEENNGSIYEEIGGGAGEYDEAPDYYGDEYDEHTIRVNGKDIVFVQRNLQVIGFEYKYDKNSDIICATAYTINDYAQGHYVIDIINFCFMILYIAEAAFFIIKYFLKVKKQSKP
ncbi:MAG: helix-turn-helix domain-containing protein [Oscillospiraceae bacterium]|nr:helix-turn-helix domain-containing protein [Oscillospiraceae bacterium]